MIVVLFSVFYVISCIILVFCTFSKKYGNYRIYSKTECSVAFIIGAVLFALLSGNYLELLRILPAFIFCLAGDIVLGFTDTSGRKKYVKAGMFLFLLAHITYVIALLFFEEYDFLALIIPAICLSLMYYIISRSLIDARELKSYIYIYTFFCSMTLSAGVSLMLARITAKYLLIFIGALCFVCSDFLLAFEYFTREKRQVHTFLHMVLYYTAQYLISFSLYYD